MFNTEDGFIQPLDKVVHEPWPKVWEFKGTEKKELCVQVALGSRVTLDAGKDEITYHCPCGSTWTRRPQMKILGTRNWISGHFDCLPEEEKQCLIP